MGWAAPRFPGGPPEENGCTPDGGSCSNDAACCSGDCYDPWLWFNSCTSDASGAPPSNPSIDTTAYNYIYIHIVVAALLILVIINVILCIYLGYYKKFCCKKIGHSKIYEPIEQISSTDDEHENLKKIEEQY
eukprot:355852_1